MTQILYKYCAKNRIGIIQNCEVRLTQPGALNDPFEMRPNISQIASLKTYGKEVMNTVPEYKHKFKSVDDLIKYMDANPDDKWMKLQKKDAEFAEIVREIIAEKANETKGILCLTEDPLNLLMWAHYGDAHTGFVIGYNTSDDFFKQQNEWDGLKRVNYSKALPNATLADVTNEQILLTKSCDWCYEREWRLLRDLTGASKVLNENSYKIHLFKMPPSCIESIILGCKSELLDQIKSLLTNADYKHIKPYKAKQSETAFELSMDKIILHS